MRPENQIEDSNLWLRILFFLPMQQQQQQPNVNINSREIFLQHE